jgi:signal transduction histidine kinase
MRYLKSQLLVWLFGGLLGPLYLIIYFAFNSPADRQPIRWMLWAGLAIAVADVLIALAVANYGAKSTAKTAALLARRHQLGFVVRRAAAARPSPAFASGPPRPSASQRLQELAGLHANEAITDDEYAERRRQIISEI